MGRIQVRIQGISQYGLYKRYLQTSSTLENITPLTQKDLIRENCTSLINYTGKDYRRMIIKSKVYDIAIETPLQEATNFSLLTKKKILFKREDLQPIFSFKIRGAYNKMAQLTTEQRNAGVICCSAGNHAQGVAISAKYLNIDAKIVMPLATPDIKINAVRQHGGKNVSVVLHGKNFDEAAMESKKLARKEKRTIILPFDDPLVIAGQGTVGMEILQQTAGKKIDAIFVPCGGGGLLAGIAAIVKQNRPEVKIVGVEAEDAAGMTESLLNNKVITLSQVGLFADGAAVKTVGTETFRLCSSYCDQMITVSNDEICQAIKLAFQDTRSILEPAGALSLAGILRYCRDQLQLINETQIGDISPGLETLIAITSGANMDFNRLRFVSERADSKEFLISVIMDEKAGTLGEFSKQIDIFGDVSITEFSYRCNYNSNKNEEKKAYIYISFRFDDSKKRVKDIIQFFDQYKNANKNSNLYEITDLSENELAKVHTRYLAGGKCNNKGHSLNERIYRFEFAQRKSAINDFLASINSHSASRWNIVLFHYRNHGADMGRVLVGFHLPEKDPYDFNHMISSLKTSYLVYEETDNEIYKQFLL